MSKTKMGFTPPVPLPPTVVRLYNRWHEYHERTGRIPGRSVPYASADNNTELLCNIADAGPRRLKEILVHNHERGLALLDTYNQEPSEMLAEEIARRMIYVDVADQFLIWIEEDEVPALGGAL
jgi:hypothetical protein